MMGVARRGRGGYRRRLRLSAKPVVEAHPEHIHGEAVVDVIQRQVGVGVANCSLGGGAGKRRVGSLAEVHVVVFRRDRPRSAQPVVKAGADIEAAGLEVLAAADATG